MSNSSPEHPPRPTVEFEVKEVSQPDWFLCSPEHSSPPDADSETEAAELALLREWSGPPDDYLPGVAPLALIIGRSDRVVVMLTGMSAFPTGLAMTLSVRTRERTGHHGLLHELYEQPGENSQDQEWKRNRFMFGFEFADGRSATTDDAHERPNRRALPEHPTLRNTGGGGSGQSSDQDYWLWPLPPAGSMRIFCQWRKLDVERTVIDIDTAPFLAAAHEATPIWTVA